MQYGTVHSSVANASSLYGQALTFQNKPRSIEVLRESLAIRRKLYDETHELIGESYGDLAYAMWRGVDPPRTSEAEEYFGEAIRRVPAKKFIARYESVLASMASRRKKAGVKKKAASTKAKKKKAVGKAAAKRPKKKTVKSKAKRKR